MSHDKASDLEVEPLDAQIIAQLSDVIAFTPIAPELAARMRTRVMAGVQGPVAAVVRATEGEWKAVLPHVSIKILHIDRTQGTQTSLWRLAPGARIPPHSHTKDEECLVLEGVVTSAGISYLQGDYLYAQAGIDHEEFTSPSGALLLLRNELLTDSQSP